MEIHCPGAPEAGGALSQPKEVYSWTEVQYLSAGNLQIEKTTAIVSCPCCKTKKEVGWCLGNADSTTGLFLVLWIKLAPLTDLTQKSGPDFVQLMVTHQVPFLQVNKVAVLHTPNLSLQFILQTDALNRRLGQLCPSR